MLHNSPSSVGIAWERDNTYWIFDGAHASLTRYQFNADHGPGGADHSDGVVQRYVEGQVARAPGISSHMEVDGDTLYVADSGNGRVVTLDVTSGTPGAVIGPNYDGTLQQAMEGAEVAVLIEAGAVEGLELPSGLAVHEGILYVTDNRTSRLFAFELDGVLVDWLDLSGEVASGGLMGIDFAPDGSLYLVDAVASRVLRLAPLP
jgi:sugar lactone lactonase YvrE